MEWGRRLWIFLNDAFFITLIISIPIAYGCGYEHGYNEAKIKENHLYRLLQDFKNDTRRN